MDNRKMEEGAITRSLIKEELYGDNQKYTGSDQIGMQPSESSSPTTFLVVFSTLVAVFGSLVFGTAIGYSSPAQSGIVSDLDLSTAEYSVFGSIVNIGAMLGALLSGRVADLIGRRGAMGFSEILCIMGWLSISFAKDAIWLDFGRFAVGCGIGLLSYVVPVYIAEITPKNVRGAFMSLNQLMLAFGKALTFIIGALVTWRTLAIIGIIPCLAQLLGLFYIPESPRWLAKVGRMQEFESALQHLRGKGADISQEAADIKDYTDYLHTVSENGIVSLFQEKYMNSLVIGVGLMLFQQFGGLNGVNFYASSIFISAGFSGTTGTITAAVVQIIVVVLGVILIDKFGRRLLLLISAVGTCLGCTIAGLSFFFQDLHLGKEVTPVLVLLGVLVYLGFVEIGMAGIPWIIMSEIFPMNVKGSAGSFVGLVNWVSSWVVAYTFNFLYQWSSVGTFLIYAAICGAGVLFIVKLVPETKGRTLEEIQASMTSGLLH